MTKFVITALLFSAVTANAQTNTFPGSGKAGVYTLSPLYNFQVQKTSAEPAMMISGGYTGSPRLQIYGLESDANAWMGLGTDMAGGPYEHSVYFPKTSINAGRLTCGSFDGTTYHVLMQLHENGNFSVNGNIRTKEVKVETANWPDYVFKPSYKLPSLQETQEFIKKNGHLPGMPSAADIETKGQNLGEINSKLLKTVEELTLHLIEKENLIKAQGAQLASQDKRLFRLEQLFSKGIKKHL